MQLRRIHVLVYAFAMAFEVFVRRSRPTTTQPVVGIQNRGTISFNQSAFALLAERMPKGAKGDVYAQLLYDRDRKMVAFRAVPEGTHNSYVVRKQQNAASYIMTGKGFLQFYGLMGETLRRYHLRPLENTLVGFSIEHDELGHPRDEEDEAQEEFGQSRTQGHPDRKRKRHLALPRRQH